MEVVPPNSIGRCARFGKRDDGVDYNEAKSGMTESLFPRLLERFEAVDSDQSNTTVFGNNSVENDLSGMSGIRGIHNMIPLRIGPR